MGYQVLLGSPFSFLIVQIDNQLSNLKLPTMRYFTNLKCLWVCFVLSLLALADASAQINGTITDPNTGEGLIGVNITVKGSESVGTITDIDGNYTIDAKDGDILVISYVGYETTEIPVTADFNGTIALAEATELLDEVVVIGYGAVGKKDLTGVVTKVNEKDFLQGTINSPEKLLNGKVAGLNISSNSDPGGESRIRIRGGTSIGEEFGASNDPLIVIDGVPMDNRDLAGSRNPLNFVNASEIASMTVLKDASAAAIYGSRGANGVIIITTKQGESGKLKIDYSGNANSSLFAGTPNQLSPDNFRNAIIAKAPQEIEFLGDQNTDWVDEVTQAATSTEHNLAVSGGKKNVNYRLFGGFLRNKGVILTSEHQTTSFGGNVNMKFFDNLLEVRLRSKTGLTTDRFSPDVMGSALAFDPTRPVFDEESVFGGYFQWNDPLAVNNPVSTLLLTNETGNATRSLNTAGLTINLPFIEGLSLTSDVSYDLINGDKRKFQDPLLKDNESFVRGGYLFLEDFENYTKQIETYGTYNMPLKKINSTLNIVAGHSWLESDQQNRWEEGRELMEENGEYIYTADIQPDSFFVTNRIISFFGRANLNIGEKYLVTGSLRRDGSSRFGQGNRWGLFPSAAVAWRVLQEDFASGLTNTFSDLKLRLSWGVTGSQEFNDFLYSTFYSYSTTDAAYQFGDQFVQTLRGIGVDPNIKWEESTTVNFGIDYGLFNNRISGSLEFYNKNTSDLIFKIAAPAFTNLSDRVITNVGEVSNKGVELTLNTVLYDRKNFGWNINLNATRNTNKIVKLDNTNDPDFGGYETGGITGDVGQTIQILKVGESLGTFRTYQHKRGADGLPLVDTEDFNGDGFIDLLDIYEDLNDDGLINENDLAVNKKAAPDLMLGLTTSFNYKQFDLSATMRSHIGNYVYNNVASANGYFDKLTDRVTNNVDASAFVLNFKERQLKSDYYVENASFFKLDNVTLGYKLKKNSVFRNFRIFGTVTNLMTLTGYSGLDPELPQYNGGIDNNLYPISRNFLIGLNIGI